MLRSLFLLIAFILAGCASSRPTPPRPAVVHIAPSTVLVARPVAAARAATVKAAESVATATTSNSRAAAIAKAIVEKGTAASAPEAVELATEINLTGAELFHATASLQTTTDQLTVADTRVAELDARLVSQTAKFNATEQKRAEADARVFDLDTQRRELTAERDKYKHALWWSKFKIWGGFIGAIGLLIAAFVFKIIGFGSRAVARVAI